MISTSSPYSAHADTYICWGRKFCNKIPPKYNKIWLFLFLENLQSLFSNKSFETSQLNWHPDWTEKQHVFNYLVYGPDFNDFVPFHRLPLETEEKVLRKIIFWWRICQWNRRTCGKLTENRFFTQWHNTLIHFIVFRI